MSIPARQYYGQVAHVIRATVAFNTPGVAAGVPLGTVPAGSRFMRIQAYVETAFNAGTSNPVTLGSTATGEEIGTAAAIVAGTVGMKELTTGLTVYPTADTTIYASYTPTGTAASAGRVTFVITYMPDMDR